VSDTHTRRDFLYLSAAIAAGAATPLSEAHTRAALGYAGIDARNVKPEGGRVILDPARFPRTLQEAPMLAELVKQGRLPPVSERIGRDPLVIEPLHEIGRYGGTLRRAFIGPSDFQGAARFTTGPDAFLYWDYEWKQLVPNIARAFDMSGDGRVLTLYLRRGMRWSDGAPFTADDVMFWYEDMYGDRRVVATSSPSLRLDDQDVVIEKVDDTTIQFVAPRPYPVLPELLAAWGDLGGPSITGRFALGGYAPKHYLSQFHAKYRSEARVTQAARDAGFASWPMYLKSRNDWVFNAELPVLSPWRVTSPINSRQFLLERNAYSIWVDTAGNQLPYIDRVTHTLCSRPEVVVFKAVAGELDFQDRHLDVGKLPVLLSNRKRSGYEVHLDPFAGTDLGVRLNIGYKEDPEIGDLLRTVSFRRALSLAVDRNAINESFLLGTGRESSAVPLPDNKYFPGAEWSNRWATYDVPQANGMLDELGLDRRDRAGYRLRRDGKGRLRLSFQAPVAHIDFPAVGEMLKDHWRAIGIDLNVEVTESTLWFQRSLAGTIQLTAQSTGSEDPLGYPDLLFPYSPTASGAVMGADYARWFQSGGKNGTEPPEELRQMMSLWQSARSADAAGRLRAGQELIRIHVDRVLSIGLVSGGLTFYGIHLAKTNLRNVPRRLVNTIQVRSPANSLPMTFFFKKDAR
jgi:peptide/nickel transport system substrate-binding protein